MIVRRYYTPTLNEEYDVQSARYGDKIVLTGSGQNKKNTSVEDCNVLIFQCANHGTVCISKADYPDFFKAIIDTGIEIDPAILVQPE